MTLQGNTQKNEKEPWTQEEGELFEAILAMKESSELYALFKDLLTPAEFKAMTERFQAARYLFQGFSQREAAKLAGVSLNTVTRVGRFLKDEHYGGYRKTLEKLSK